MQRAHSKLNIFFMENTKVNYCKSKVVASKKMNPLLFRFNFSRGTIESFDCVEMLAKLNFKFILQPLLNVHNPQHIHQLFNKKLNFQLDDLFTNNKWSLLFHPIHNSIMDIMGHPSDCTYFHTFMFHLNVLTIELKQVINLCDRVNKPLHVHLFMNSCYKPMKAMK